MSSGIAVADLGLAAEMECMLDAAHAARLAVALASSVRPVDGGPLPFLWHWGWFGPVVATAELGSDGHPRLSSPVGRQFPRRMWASGSLQVVAPFVVGRPVVRRSAVEAVTEKAGRSGAMLLVEVTHRYAQGGRDLLAERQTLIYRTAGGSTDMPVGDFVPVAAAGEWCEPMRLGPVDLFRFSAVTFNSHRIHYDAPYTQTMEGYPGLVVHGPLTALRLAESVRRATGRQITAMQFRAVAPLFADVPFTIIGRTQDDQRATVAAVRNDATTAMTAELELS